MKPRKNIQLFFFKNEAAGNQSGGAIAIKASKLAMEGTTVFQNVANWKGDVYTWNKANK